MQTERITHHTVTVNNIKLHYVDAGQGPPVFLLHGFPEFWFAWRKQIPVLAQYYRVIAPDLRGYGDSEKPPIGYDKRTMATDIYQLMHHLGYDRIALIGHDRGARVATRFAKDYRSAIDRLVVLDNIPTRIIMQTLNAERARRQWFFLFNQIRDLPEALIAGREEIWLRYFFRTWSYNPEMMSDEEVAVYVKAYSQPGALRGAFNDYRAAPEDVAQDEADADQLIDCPTLVLWGADSEVVPALFDVMQIWSSMAHNVHGAAIPHCGHLPPEEQPNVVNKELLTFLGGWTG
ncbi:MAG TPA: alpha/beta hydrolase [Ktedonobacteraceae bacterium]